MRNPTMKKSGKVESEVDAKNLALIQQLNDLEYIWKCQQEWRSGCPRSRSCSTASDSNSITSFDHLFQISPRTLMSSLQHRRLKNCSDDAVEEILMDRRAAIMSGRFKGRQLFGEESAVSHSYSGGGEVWMNNGIQDYDGSGESSESCSFPEEKTVVEVGDARGGDGRRKEKDRVATAVVEVGGAAENRGGDGRRRVATASLGVVLIVLALVLFSMSCNGNNVEELILVPT